MKYSHEEEELILSVLLDCPGNINQKTNILLKLLPDRTFYGIQKKLLRLAKDIEEDSKGNIKIYLRKKYK